MQQRDWFLDEGTHAGEEHLDTEYVATYDRKAGTDPAEDVALLRGLGLGTMSTLVDLGAGTGAFALTATPYCQRVIAVDVSPAMLAVMRARAAAAGLTNFETARGGFLTYEHRGDPADCVYSRNALHHLPDFWKAIALARIAALLRPGGVLYLRDLVFSFAPHEAERAIEAWLDKASATSEVGWTRSELETHLREEYSTFSWLLEPMLTQAGFIIQHAEQSPSGIYAAYTCVKRVS